MDLAGKRVVVMGLGRFGGGVGAARYAVRQRADVLVTDTDGADRLAESLRQLEPLGIETRLGEHREDDFASADLVIVNPAVDRRGNRYLQAAEAAGVAVGSEIQLLTQRLPNRRRTIGVTGTSGKSTVTAMIGHLLTGALGPDRVHVGGNIGGSLLESVDRIGRDHWVVLELSSFMLEALDRDRWSPGVAVVTNIAPNHLDRHGSMEDYVSAKQTLLRYQHAQDKAILGGSVADWPVGTGVTRCVVDDSDYDIEIAVPGRHNRFNAMCAISVGEMIVLQGENLLRSLADFSGLPHRLQFIAEHRGVRYYNDSKSTTPQSAELAIGGFPRHTVHAILGGCDKGSDLSGMASLAGLQCRAVYTIGATGETIAATADGAGRAGVVRCATLDRAVRSAVAAAQPGDVVLLSPGCASWDQFENYERRGAAFVEEVVRATASVIRGATQQRRKSDRDGSSLDH